MMRISVDQQMMTLNAILLSSVLFAVSGAIVAILSKDKSISNLGVMCAGLFGGIVPSFYLVEFVSWVLPLIPRWFA
ncbi:hypothetical protein UFOVP1244_133 [uncultured Caudovirales phage]|uniref:Uncharacterized protein n=1 Tax=uncultured Caudovirales phage TaxID=2100421 RepID=A0A6J5R663_9CAUD|nr:hypothetical protein UFOVP1244_133 [uncultured Caudovirales phage]